MDPAVKKYFQKILNSFAMGLLWMFSAITMGFYLKMAIVGKSFAWYNGVFYAFLFVSFGLLIRYYYRTWRNPGFVAEEL